MGILTSLVCLAAAVVVFAALVHDPVPAGCEQNAMVWTTLSMIKTFNYLSRIFGVLGFQEAVINRKLMASFSSLSPPISDPEVTVNNMVIEGVSVRLYRPVSVKSPSKAVVWYHGGGWTFGDADTYQNMLIGAAKDLQSVVLYIEYRLAPEHAYPAPLEDCELVTKHFLSNAAKYGVDSARVALVGDSAGGTLTAVIARRLKNQHFKPMPKLQVMIYPVTQVVDFDTPSYRANQNGPFLTRSYMVLYISSYLFGENYARYWNDFLHNRHTTSIIKKSNARTYINVNNLPKDSFISDYKPELEHGDQKLWNEVSKLLTDPDISPIFATDLSGLPPAFVSTCQNDVLRDDGILYVKRLRDSGVKVTHVNIPACYHGWIWHRGFSKAYEKEFQKIMKYINENL